MVIWFWEGGADDLEHETVKNQVDFLHLNKTKCF